ncbi:MAG: ATP-binding cassette domain-containing protein, partial [Anaerolineae bacterium]|nr:ATP-binding cassette domain-containing protein [Phycisphaerae bacterium]
MPEIAIKVDSVTKIYGTRKVLDAIKLDVYQGETLVILGGSGSGKSTLLRVMIGNVLPDQGDIVALGKCICKMSAAELDDYRKSVGVLFQSGALYNSMSVADNIALPLREHSELPEETIGIMVKIKLELVGLRESAEKMPAELSGG